MKKEEFAEKRLRYLLSTEPEAVAFRRFEKEFSKKELEDLVSAEKPEVAPEPKALEGEEKRQAAKRSKKE